MVLSRSAERGPPFARVLITFVASNADRLLVLVTLSKAIDDAVVGIRLVRIAEMAFLLRIIRSFAYLLRGCGLLQFLAYFDDIGKVSFGEIWLGLCSTSR